MEKLLFVLLTIVSVTNIGYSQNVGVWNNTDGSLRLGTTTLEIIHINTDGNVGIGESVPMRQLHVAGAVRLTPLGTPPATPEMGDMYIDGTGQLYVFNGSTWDNLSAGSSGWSLSGNAGTVDGTNFIGTTDDMPFNIRVNNQKAGRIESNSFVGNNKGNIFFGYQSGNANTSGNYNTTLGHRTLFSNTSGYENVAVGRQALNSNVSGSTNTAIGVFALSSNSTAHENTAIGHSTLSSNTVGGRNTAVGLNALALNVAGSNITAIGYNAMYYANSTSTPFTNYNVAVGYEALRGSTTPANNTGNSNTALGYQSLNLNTKGGDNVAVGTSALLNNSNASQNVAIGKDALFTQSFANAGIAWATENVAIGYQALYSTQPTSNINAVGNTGVGSNALRTNTTGFHNTAIGLNAMYSNTTGNNNTAVGWQTLYNSTGQYNTALGVSAQYSNTSGYENAAVGTQALWWNTTGFGNVAMGFNSGGNNTTGSNNTFIGYGTGLASATQRTNATAIGYEAKVDASNALVLGGTGANAVNVGIGLTTPTYPLHVKNITHNLGMRIDGAIPNTGGFSNQVLFLSNDQATTPPSGMAAYMVINSQGTGNSDAYINFRRTNAEKWSIGNDGSLSDAFTIAEGDFASNQRFTVIPGGNVGIGTTTPAAKLDITGDGSTILIPRKSTTGDPAGGVNGMIYYNTLDAKFRVFENGAWKDWVTPAGTSEWTKTGSTIHQQTLTDNVGIGLNTAGAKLDVHPASSYSGVLGQFQNDNSGNGSSVLQIITNGSGNSINISNSGFGKSLNISSTNNTSSTNAVDISTNGNSSKSLYVTHTGASNSATDYGVYATSTGGGTTTTNVGGYFSATGATNNYAAIFEQGSVGIGTTTPTAKLDITGDGSTILIPRKSTTGDPAGGINGMIYYNELDGKFRVYENGAWKDWITPGSNPGWELTGNSGTNPATDFLGPTDDVPFSIKINGLLAGRIESDSYNENTTLGFKAGSSTSTGIRNTAVGLEALLVNTSGNNNVSMGFQSLYANTMGSGNTAIGSDAGTGLNPVTTGSNNTFLGANTGLGSATQRVNATAIGYNAKVDADNAMVLGGTGADAVSVGIGTVSPVTPLHVASNSGQTGIAMQVSQNSSSGGGFFNLKSRGTISSPLTVSSGDFLGGFGFVGHDGTSFGTPNAEILARAEENFTPTNKGTSIVFSTTAIGTALSQDRLKINSDGKVGIGTLSPVTKLHIASNSDAYTVLQGSDAATAPAHIVTRSRGTMAAPAAIQSGDMLGSYVFMGYDGASFLNSDGAGIQAKASEDFTPAGQGTELRFLTIPNGSTSNESRMIIKENGNVGIGTLSADEKLQVANNAATGDAVAVSLLAGTTGNATYYMGNLGNKYLGAIRYNNSTNTLDFWTNNTPNRIKIDGSGNVAIPALVGPGTVQVDASGNLSVASGGTVTGGGAVNFIPKWTSATNLGVSSIDDNGARVAINTFLSVGAGSPPTNQKIYAEQGAATGRAGRFEILNSSNPDEALFVTTNGTGKALSVSNTNASTGTKYGIYSTAVSAVASTAVAGYFSSTGGGTNYAAIFENGNVGIGTVDPAHKLEINSSTNPVSGSNLTIGNIPLKINNSNGANGDGTGIRFAVSTAVGNTGGGAIVFERTGANSQGKMHFSTKSSTTADATIPIRMTLDQNGNVGIGRVDPPNRLSVSGVNSIVESTVAIESFNSSSTVPPVITFRKSPSNVIGAFAPVVANESLGIVRAYGGNSTSSAYIESALIAFQADAAPTASNLPGRIIFQTDDGTSLATRMTISSSGNVGIGTTAPSFKLQSITTTAGDRALHGENTFGGGTDGYGVYGRSVNAAGFGFGGYFEGGYRGVEALGNSTAATSTFGVLGRATGSGGNRFGVYGQATTINTANNYGLYGEAQNGSGNYGLWINNGETKVTDALGVVPTRTANGSIATSNNGGTRFWFRTNNTNYFINSSGAGDYSEYFKTADTTLAVGEIVSLSSIKDNAVQRANSKEQMLLGVVSKYGTRNNDDQEGQRMYDKNSINIALLGQLQVKVSVENGNIAPGDPLTLSEKYPGVAVKAITDGKIIGYAMTHYPYVKGEEHYPVHTDSKGEQDCLDAPHVMALVQPSYWSTESSQHKVLESQKAEIEKLKAENTLFKNDIEKIKTYLGIDAKSEK